MLLAALADTLRLLREPGFRRLGLISLFLTFTLAAQRHLAPPDIARLRGAARGRIWLAGCLMALPLSVPVINLAVPFLGAGWSTLIFRRLRA